MSASDIELGAGVSAAVVGAVFADYITWVARSILLLPHDVYHGVYDGTVNILFAWFLVTVAPIEAPTTGESFATASLVFFAVLVLKAIVYGIEYLRYSFDDGL